LAYPEQARHTSQDGLAWSRELAHPYSTAFALAGAVWLNQFSRDGRGTLEGAERLMVLAAEQGFGLWSAWASLFRGWALTEQGQGDEGLALMRQGLGASRATGAEVERPYWLALYADASRQTGQVEQGLTALAEALLLVHKTGERWWEAELHRLKGELRLAQSYENWRAAEESFHQAIDIARRQHAKSLELRAATSLSGLWQRLGRREDARRMLAEVCGWFTEGFEFSDLRAARALLDELSTA
jgi:predicted ATPase